MVWTSATAVATVLDSPNSFKNVTVTGMSSSGMVVGTATQISNGEPRGVTWSSPTAGPTLLSLGVYFDAQATGVSATGQIVGWGIDGSTFGLVGLVWPSASALPTQLPAAGYRNVQVAGVSPTGMIFGEAHSTVKNGQVRLVWSNATTSPTELVPPAGYLLTNVQSISSTGQALGTVLSASTFHIAVFVHQL